MSPIGPNLTRFRLDPESRESLRQQFLRRDRWRCQSCDTMSNLEVHHKQFRSHSGTRLRREPNHGMLHVSCIGSRTRGIIPSRLLRKALSSPIMAVLDKC
jgi:5-methylcytosine-specific restriction endonuclease McrA